VPADRRDEVAATFVDIANALEAVAAERKAPAHT
jgi:hypothetical protein